MPIFVMQPIMFARSSLCHIMEISKLFHNYSCNVKSEVGKSLSRPADRPILHRPVNSSWGIGRASVM